MKIENSGKTLGLFDASSSAKTTPKASALRNESESANVAINPAASRLQAIEANLGQGQSFDAGKVAEIRQAISEGRFSVNPDAIADKLISSVKALLDAQHGNG